MRPVRSIRSVVAIAVLIALVLATPLSAAHAPKLSNVGANAGADAIGALLNNGYLRIYDGTQATDADTALTTQTLLVELRWNATAFAASSGGVATANVITSGNAVATSTATWFRALKADGTTVVFDGSVCATGGGCDLELATASITTGASVSVSSFTYTHVKS